MSETLFYSLPNIFEHEKCLRGEITLAERILWSNLAERKLNGLLFKRRQAVAGFIADFYCHEFRLDIEIEGSIIEEAKYIAYRNSALQSRGITVIHFTDEEIFCEIEQVINKIKETILNKPSLAGTEEEHYENIHYSTRSVHQGIVFSDLATAPHQE